MQAQLVVTFVRENHPQVKPQSEPQSQPPQHYWFHPNDLSIVEEPKASPPSPLSPPQQQQQLSTHHITLNQILDHVESAGDRQVVLQQKWLRLYRTDQRQLPDPGGHLRPSIEHQERRLPDIGE